MKTSHILLLTTAVSTLTGLVATDILLKEQYTKIDWSDKYQTFVRKSLPAVRHLSIEGAPVAEIVLEKSSRARALVNPAYTRFYRLRQQNDTVFVYFTPKYVHNNPRDEADNELEAGLVLRLPDLQSVHVANGRLTLRGLTPAQLVVDLQNSRLRTDRLTVAGSFALTARQNSFARLGADRCQTLRVAVRDSSGIRLNDTQTGAFLPEVSRQAEVQLSGQAVRWLN